LDAAITDLRAPLDLTADPVKVSEDLERTRRNLLKEAIDVETLVGASSPRSKSTTPPTASLRLETALAGRDKFVNEAASWARS
jgi:hypothetical protein